MAGSLGKQRREAGCAETWLPEPGPAVVPLVAVFVTTAVRTSAGPGPGVRRAPPGEVVALVNGRRAVYGDQPQRGYSDGGTDTRDVARMMPRKP